MKPASALVTLCVLATVDRAQVPREPVSVVDDTADWVSDMASRGNVSAVAWGRGPEDSPFAPEVLVSTSDGRGLGWSPPVRADEDDSGAQKVAGPVAILGSRVVVFWRDGRNDDPSTGPTEWDVYFNTLDVATRALEGERLLDVPAGTQLEFNNLRVAADVSAAGEHLHVLFRARAADGSHPAAVYLRSSADAGRTFGAATALSPTSVHADTAMAIAARANSVYVAWVDERNGPGAEDLFLQVSHAAGASGSFLPDDVHLNTGGPVFSIAEIDLDVSGETIATAWREDDGNFSSAIWSRSSEDGGGSFGSAQKLSQPSTFTYTPSVGVDRSTGNVIVTWSAQPSANLEVFVSTSSDGGATYSPPLQLSSKADPYSGSVVAAGPARYGCPVTAVSWWDFHDGPFGGPHPQARDLRAAVTRDGGLTWDDPVVVHRAARYAAFYVAAYNDLYRNFLFAWRDYGDPPRLLSGGFRPQSVHPRDLSAGPSSVSFDFELFEPATDSVAWALLALTPSDLLAVEGKILGLFPDALFAQSLGLAAAGVLAGPIDDEGSGSTLAVDVDVPPGTRLYLVGIGLDPRSARVEVGSLTDVREITAELR